MTFKHMHQILCAGIACVLSGCAGVSPDRLEAVKPTKALFLQSEFSYEAVYPLGNRWRWTLASGQYVAHKQDPHGLYYVGPGQCLSQTEAEAGQGGGKSILGKTLGAFGCGIYVPNDSTQDPKVFLLIGTWQGYPNGKLPASSTTVDLDPNRSGVAQSIAATAAPSATPLQPTMGGAVGGAIGGGIVGAAAAAEQGNYALQNRQPPGADLRRALASN